MSESNNKIPPPLQQAIANNNLIPLLGAGVSLSIIDNQGNQVFPSWQGLLENAASEMKAIDSPLAMVVEGLVKAKKWQDAAQYAHEGLKQQWKAFLSSQFDPDFDQLDQTCKKLPHAIWQLSNRLITLNYDKVMPWGHQQSSNVSAFDNHAVSELGEFETNLKKYQIWHLHGHIDNTKDIVLTPLSYDRLYDPATPIAALEVFKTVCRQLSLLFIGCSLDDAELLAQIHQQQQLFANNIQPHYALVHQAEYDLIATKLAGTDINLIGYSDFGQPLVDLVNELASYRTATPIAPPAAVSESDIVQDMPEHKIVLLSVNPLDWVNEDGLHQLNPYADLLKAFNKSPILIEHRVLSRDVLHDVAEYQTIIIAAPTKGDKLLIESEQMMGQAITITELIDCFEQQQMVFMWLDKLPQVDLSQISLPLYINRFDNNGAFNTFVSKWLKQGNSNFFDKHEPLLCHRESFSGNKNTGRAKGVSQLGIQLPSFLSTATVGQFVGRTNELKALTGELLQQQDIAGVLTIKGSGGIGKTTIAKKLAFELVKRGYFASKVSFIDCESLTTANDFARKLAGCFDLAQAEQWQEAIKLQFEQQLRQQRLIVIDNLETLLTLADNSQVASVTEYIAFICRYTMVIVTSRERINIDEEQVFDIRQMTAQEGLTLFEQGYYRAHRQSLKLNEQQQGFLINQILDEQLNFNALAISIVTATMLANKDLTELQQELRDDIFAKVSDEDIEIFYGKSDENVSRKKSIYGSILYSYQSLTADEQQVFELLALFPDGINFSQFKQLVDQSKKAKRGQGNKQQQNQPLVRSSMLTERSLNKLVNKSLVEQQGQQQAGLFSLQSLVGRFAEAKLAQRQDKTAYYKQVLQHNFTLVAGLNDLSFRDKNKALTSFEAQRHNALKALELYPQVYSQSVRQNVLEQFQRFVFQVGIFSQEITNLASFIKVLAELIEHFSGIDRLFIQAEWLKARYYDGDFSAAFDELKQLLPQRDLIAMQADSFVKEKIIESTLPLYQMEGEIWFSAKWRQQKQRYNYFYPQDLYQLGIYYQQFATQALVDITSLEVEMAFGDRRISKIDAYLAKLNDKQHLERMQVSFLKAKYQPLTLAEITPLVVVNPYTQGLKNLMLAFVNKDVMAADELYQQAINELEHIKYYWVEAQLLYAQFLQQVESQQLTALFDAVLQQGLARAKQYHFRYLYYQFQLLSGEVVAEFDATEVVLRNYDESESLDLTDYIQGCIRFAKQIRKQYGIK